MEDDDAVRKLERLVVVVDDTDGRNFHRCLLPTSRSVQVAT